MKYLYVTLFVIANICLSGLSAQETELLVTNELTLHEVNFDANGEARVHLKGLVPGDRFEFHVVQAKNSPYVAFSSIPEEVDERDPNSLLGVAEDRVLTFCLDALYEQVKYVEVGVLKNGKTPSPSAQLKVMDNVIEVEETNDLDYMLNTIFRQDTCFALFPGNLFPLARRPLTDSTFTGQSGIFRNGRASVGIDSGIIITSGTVLDAPGPNDPMNPAGQVWDFGNNWNGLDADADVLAAGRGIFDLVIMDFDFIPTTDTISFNYVFFSEQYCDIQGGDFDADAFGFILTGPDGIPVNIARLPVSGDIVSPATLSPGTPDEAFFVNNTTSAFGAQSCGGPDPPTDRFEGINYNGFSRKLTAKGAVIPCARHTLKVIVMDVEDAFIDSGVLLEAGSFLASLVNKPEPNTTAQVSRLNPVEGCDTALVTFTRRTLDAPFINQPLMVKYNIIPIVSGDTTEAVRGFDPDNTAGADYLLPESPFIIPGGDTSATLRIPILADLNFAEGIEAFVIRYDGTCDCTENADTFYIQDNVDFQVSLGDDFVACADVNLTLAATPLGGNGTYTYLWPNGETDSLINYVSTGRDTTIIVQLTDGCGLSGRDTLNILAPTTTASVAGTYTLCEDEVADVLVDLEGDGPFTLTLRIDSSGVVTEETYVVTDDSTFQFDYSADVTVVSVLDAGGCGGGADGTATVRTPDVPLDATVVQPVCNQNLGSIVIVTDDGNNNFSFAWSDDAGASGGSRDQLGPGTYTVAILRSGASCPDSVEFVLQTTPDLAITGFDFTAPTCPGETVVLAPLVSGGAPPYTFSWPDSMTTDSLLTVTSINGPVTYPVMVTDSCGFTTADSVILNLPIFDAVTSGRFSLCNDASVDVPLAVTGPSGNYAVVVRIDSAGVTINRPLTLTPGVTFLPFDYPATVTVLSVTNANGCPGNILPDTARVVDPQITFNGVVTDVNCNLGNDGTITLTDAATVPVTFTWSDGASTGASRENLTAGTYTVTITDAADASCARDTTFTVDEPDPLAIQMTVGDASCPFQTDTLSPVFSGGTAPYTYSWPDSMTTDSMLIITTQPGVNDYPVFVTDSCGATVSLVFTYDFPDVQASLAGEYAVCNAPFRADVPLDLRGSTGYTVTISENGTERTLAITGDTTLSYTEATDILLLAVSGADGCAGTAAGAATVTDAAFDVTAAVTSVICRGELNGAIDVDVNGRSTDYTFDWENPALSGPSPSGLGADTFRVRIIDNTPALCTFDTFFVVAEPAAPLLLVNREAATCQGETIDLVPTVTGGTRPYAYDWSNGVSIDSVFTITTVGGDTIYPLAVTDACGVVLRDTIALSLSDTRAEVSGNYSVCNPPFNTDVPFTFSGNGPFTFVVEENGVARTLVLRNGQDTSLNYVEAVDIQLLSVTGGDGCPGTAGGIANVTDGTFVVIPEVRDVLCTNATTGAIDVVVNGNNTIYAFNWDQPGLDGPSVSGLAAGVYGLTVTDLTPDACAWDTSFLVLEPATAIRLMSDSLRDEDCRQPGFASATYNGGTGELTYTWSNGTDGPVLGEAAAGRYTLSVTDVNGCVVTQPFNIQDERTEVLASISQSAVELTCAEPTLDLIAQQNTQTVGWEWRDADGDLISDLRQATVGAAGWYYLTVTNPDNGCFAVDSINVAASGDLLTLELEPEALISCVNSSVDFEVSLPDFTGAVTYRWRFNGAVVSDAAGLTDITAIGTYEVTVRRDDNGCEAVALVEVRRNIDRPVVSVLVPVVTTSCRLPEASIAVNANGPFNYDWSTANGNISGANGNRDILVDRPGTYRVVVTDTINGCTTMASVSVVTDGATLTPDAGTDQPLLCTGQGTVLNASVTPRLNNTKLRWLAPDGELIGENTQVFAQTPGAHVLEVIHPVSGCSSFDTVIVFSEAPTSVRYSLQQPPCPEVGGRLFVTGVTGLNPPFTFSSPTGETEPFGGGLRGLRVGSNVLVVTDQSGCELRDTFQMFSGFDFTGEADDVTIVLGEEATLGVTTNRDEGEIVSYDWSNLNDTLACLNCPDPRVSPLESFIAEVTITDSNGCALTLRQDVIVGENELIYMPTAFSPGNGDGINDIYTVFGNSEFVQNVNWLRIFDRWGNLVHARENFEVNDPDAGWNGAAADGRPAPAAAYAYSVSYVRWDNETVVKTGSFTLVR